MAGRNAEISIAQAPAEISVVQAIFREYAEFLKVDLCFQGFDKEMATFPAFYDFLLLGSVDGAPAGAVGLKDSGQGACEMKRLYVRPPFQTLGLGRKLAVALIDEARRRHYRVMRLDTLPRLERAIALYRNLGFAETGKYYDSPLPGVLYMSLDLHNARADQD